MEKSTSNKISNMSIVCAFCVVLIHCRPQFEFGTFSWWIKQMLENGLCTIAVPFFFVVSGFMLSRHVNENGWYIRENKKRLLSLLFPYFCWSTLYFLYGYVCNKLFGITFVLNDVMSFYGVHYGELPALSPLWYVRALLVLFILSPLWLQIGKSKYVGLLILFIIYGIVCPGPNGEGWVHSLTRVGILPVAGVFYFTTGLVIGQHPIRITLTRCHSVFFLSVGLLLSFMQAIFHYLNINQWAQYWGWLAIPFMMIGMWGLIPNKQWPKWLISESFPIFLMHKFLFPSSLANLNTVLECGIFGCITVAVLVFGFSLCATILFRKVMPKVARFCFGGR